MWWERPQSGTTTMRRHYGAGHMNTVFKCEECISWQLTFERVDVVGLYWIRNISNKSFIQRFIPSSCE